MPRGRGPWLAVEPVRRAGRPGAEGGDLSPAEQYQVAMVEPQRLRLLERNALAMIYKNYEQASLERAASRCRRALLFRGLQASGIDTLQLPFSVVPPDFVDVDPRLIAHLIALEDFCRQLPALERKTLPRTGTAASLGFRAVRAVQRPLSSSRDQPEVCTKRSPASLSVISESTRSSAAASRPRSTATEAVPRAADRPPEPAAPDIVGVAEGFDCHPDGPRPDPPARVPRLSSRADLS